MSTEAKQEDVVDPRSKLGDLRSFTNDPFDSRVLSFAEFIGKRIDGISDEYLSPANYTMACELALYDIRRGIDGWTGEDLETGLEDQPDYVYMLLRLNIPNIAEAAFPDSFAKEVGDLANRSNSKTGIQGNELVSRPVVNLEQAEEVIINSGKWMVEQLDWGSLGVEDTTHDVSDVYDVSSGLILRNSGMNFSLNVFMGDNYNEAMILKNIDSSRKRQIGDGSFWLAMRDDEISVEDATLMRDWLYFKSIEVILSTQELDLEKAIDHFSNTDSIFNSTVSRLQMLMANRQA